MSCYSILYLQNDSSQNNWKTFQDGKKLSRHGKNREINRLQKQLLRHKKNPHKEQITFSRQNLLIKTIYYVFSQMDGSLQQTRKQSRGHAQKSIGEIPKGFFTCLNFMKQCWNEPKEVQVILKHYFLKVFSHMMLTFFCQYVRSSSPCALQKYKQEL